MKTSVKWVGGAAFIGESPSGHAVVMDGPEAHGGRNIGPRPMEMILLGLGGCTNFDVIHILEKGRNAVQDCEVEISAERADEPPAVFTKIHIHFKVRGENLREAVVKRAVDLSAEKYCSASIMLAKTAEITHSYEIVA